eukprot:SAG22_NODE_12083_length_457_cov_0.726257_2_plen_20_part_01
MGWLPSCDGMPNDIVHDIVL